MRHGSSAVAPRSFAVTATLVPLGRLFRYGDREACRHQHSDAFGRSIRRHQARGAFRRRLRPSRLHGGGARWVVDTRRRLHHQGGPDALGLSVWDVGEVPRHPCRWQGTETESGPTVDDLVEVLTSQRLRDASAPSEVTLAGHEGLYLEWSVPDDWIVTGDSAFQGCDDAGDFVSWWGKDAGQRYQQVAGQVDRLWILNVEGQTLLLDATYSPDTSAADREELEHVVASVRFIEE